MYILYILVIHGCHSVFRFAGHRAAADATQSQREKFLLFIRRWRLSAHAVPSFAPKNGSNWLPVFSWVQAKGAQSYNKNKDNKMHKSNFNLQLQVLGVLPYPSVPWVCFLLSAHAKRSRLFSSAEIINPSEVWYFRKFPLSRCQFDTWGGSGSICPRNPGTVRNGKLLPVPRNSHGGQTHPQREESLLKSVQTISEGTRQISLVFSFHTLFDADWADISKGFPHTIAKGYNYRKRENQWVGNHYASLFCMCPLSPPTPQSCLWAPKSRRSMQRNISKSSPHHFAPSLY